MSGQIDVARSIDDLNGVTSGRFVVTDDNVYSLYPTLFSGAKEVFVIKHGEDSKTVAQTERLLEKMAGAGLDRKSVLVAAGGGVVGDLAGFAAAVYMRGIDWINVPTSLLAQVDSSIGGKTGVDLMNYKNMVGAFHRPIRVATRTDFLKTLPQREILCGLGEAYKSALLDKECMKVWEKLGRDLTADTDYFELVSVCAKFKQSVTSEDFKESGRRKILNLGHTVGHALEYLDGHELSHGLYVAFGLAAEAGIARNKGLMSDGEYESIYSQCRLLAGAEFDKLKAYDGKAVAAAAMADKKNRGGKISVIVSSGFKQSELFFEENELAREIENWRYGL